MTDQHEGRGTERVESQRRLAPTEGAELATYSSGVVLHQLLAVAETMQLGVIIADGFGTILYANPAQARMYGVDTPDEIIGADVTIFCLSEQRDPLMGRRLGGVRSWRRESVNLRKDGTVFPVLLLSDVFRDSDGMPMGVITTCEDLTQVKLAETERNRVQLQVSHTHSLENLEAIRKGLTPVTVPGEFEPLRLGVAAFRRVRSWRPLSFGRCCPRCGQATCRIRTVGYAKSLRYALGPFFSSRMCRGCLWKGWSSPDLCVKAEEAPRLRLGCLGDLLFLEE